MIRYRRSLDLGRFLSASNHPRQFSSAAVGPAAPREATTTPEERARIASAANHQKLSGVAGGPVQVDRANQTGNCFYTILNVPKTAT